MKSYNRSLTRCWTGFGMFAYAQPYLGLQA